MDALCCRQMASPLLQLRVKPELLDRVDAAAKAAGVNRRLWVVQALESALSEACDGGPGSVAPSPPAASSRALIPRQVAGARIVRASSLLKDAGAYRPIKKGAA